MSESLWRRLFHGVRHFQQRPDWARFAGPMWEDRIMTADITDRFHAKQGRSTGRWILHAREERLAVYLKRHYRLAWWRGLLASLWPGAGWSPAWQELRHLEWARAQGIPVPAVVAAGEYIGPWGKLQSFLAVEELADMLPLHEAIPAAAARLDPAVFRSWKRGLVQEVARLVRELHRRRCFHKDLYLCHFYIPRADTEKGPVPVPVFSPSWRGRVHVIDLHRLGRHPWTWRWWQVKDLGQLLYSSNDVVGIEPGDRVRFWRAYIGPAHRSWLNRWLRRLVLFRWRGYRRHNMKKESLVSGES
jgi:heptose I phosphotransferase